MKKLLNVLLIIFTILFILGSVFIIYCLCVTVNEKLNVNALTSENGSLTIYDCNNEIIAVSGNVGQKGCSSGDIPEHVKNAFVAIEDKRFYKHKGLDYKRILKATAKNAIHLSFKEGASTISQQLVKNTQLSSKKTLNRKLKEMKLALALEKKYDKDTILNMYLNTIYFGEGTYGIKSASEKYFYKSPCDLSIDEGAYLAGIVKAPSRLSADYDKAISRRNLVLKCMYEQGYIDKNTFDKCRKTQTIIKDAPANKSNDYYVKKVYAELENLGFDPNLVSGYKIYTSFDENICKSLKQAFLDCKIDCNYEMIVFDKNGLAVSNLNSIGAEIKRSVGSAIKPLLVYAPCIEENIISPLTKIEDTKIDFNGYCPSNYNNAYGGYMSCTDALKKSSNCVAVKLMNVLTPEKALDYAEKMDISLNYEKDANLSLALGCSENGQSLEEIASCYGTFINEGFYYKNHYINEIKNADGKTVYKYIEQPEKVFGKDTAFLVQNMLKENAKSGTAKKLNYLNFDVGAKTGTVGDKNGNEDAVCIAFTSDYIVGIRLFTKENALPNSVTGGTYPTFIARSVLTDVYKTDFPKNFVAPESVKKIAIDKYIYDNFNELVISDDEKSEKIFGYFKTNNLPTKTVADVLTPTVSSAKLSVLSKEIQIELCLTKNCDFRLFKVYDKKSECIYDSLKQGKTEHVTDDKISPNTIYEYYAVPYYEYNGNEITGKKYEIGKVKTPDYDLPDKWWE